ncbi:MAG: hypothetical protein ACOYB2_02490 [Limnohabitans sp.]
MKLTAKQQRFAELVALEGMTQADAYREAYAAGNMKPETIWARASELMADSKVSARVAELKAEIQSQTVEKELWSRVDSIVVLKEIATDQEARGNEKVSAVKELNAMHGFSITKVEHSGNIAALEVLENLTPGQMVRASLALLRQHCNGPERAEIVEFAQHVMEGEGYAFDE